MRVFVAKKIGVVLFILSLFSCGELETMLPSNGSYQIRTLVNGNSLEDCSIIRSDDKVRPYFAVSVADDPDLVGFLMYLQNSRGEIAGEKVRYILNAYADERAQEEIPVQEKTDPPKANDEALNETEATEENIEEATAVPALPSEMPEAKEKRAFVNTKIMEKSAAIEIAVKSLSGELPYFPLPKNMEPGSYILVFEALGKREVLSRIETNVFILDNVEFNLKDVSVYLPYSYLPGLSGSQLIPPETNVMLETGLDFDSRLDPYVVWYNGKNIISEGKFSDGAGNILWKAPAQVGFYSLRMEVFPLLIRRNSTGISREVTLPVSPKATSPGYFFENNADYTVRSPLARGTNYSNQTRLTGAASTENSDGKTTAPVSPPKLLRWYQFSGSLRDSISPMDEQSLLAVSKKNPRWVSAGQSYGLSTEVNDSYQLSAVNFFLKEQDRGGGIFLFHIKPSTEGSIFNAFFPMLTSEKDGAWMDMIREKNAIVLRLGAGGTMVEIPVYADFSESQGLIPIAVEFYILPNLLQAKISLGENMHGNAGKITLTGALSGEGSIRLGGEKNSTAQASIRFEPIGVNIAETHAAYQANTIWDEFAILFSPLPLLEEEFSAATVTETAKKLGDSPETDQKTTPSLADDGIKTVGGEEAVSPELGTSNSTQKQGTSVTLTENN